MPSAKCFVTLRLASITSAGKQIRTELAQQAANRIRTFTLGVGKSVTNDTPNDEGFNGRAAALVTHFAQHVRSLSDPAKLQKVERAVSNLLRPEEEAPGTAKAIPRRKRRGSG
jgi:hypothetical protein